MSYHKIGKHEEARRSSKTVSDHLHDHNAQIDKRGYCVRCRRIKGPLAEVKVSLAPVKP